MASGKPRGRVQRETKATGPKECRITNWREEIHPDELGGKAIGRRQQLTNHSALRDI
jgi:hypothetical protein